MSFRFVASKTDATALARTSGHHQIDYEGRA
jgi:hypothetical protein